MSAWGLAVVVQGAMVLALGGLGGLTREPRPDAPPLVSIDFPPPQKLPLKPPVQRAAPSGGGVVRAVVIPTVSHPSAAPMPAITIAPDVAPVAAMGSGSGNGAGLGIGSGLGGGAPVIKIAGDIQSARDYPRAGRDLRVGDYVIVAISVGADGRPTACRIHRASRDADADAITCRLALERFRFRPATDGEGRPIATVYGWRQAWFY